jgi:hypothetical protein
MTTTSPQSHGISLAAGPEGRRSSSAFGREVVAAALRAADPVGARGAERETNWRSEYLVHFRRLIEAGLITPQAWHDIAAAGLIAASERMTFIGDGESPVDRLVDEPAHSDLFTVEVTGEGTPAGELVVPYRGERLSGDALHRQLGVWVAKGVMEPSAADALGEVMEHPEWLSAPGHTIAVLGAGSEMGPASTLLRWGATVAAVDLPRPDLWARLIADGERFAGRLLAPVPTAPPAEGLPASALAQVAGADLLADVPAVADWLLTTEGRLVLGNYLYADGAAHIRVSMAADVLGRRLRKHRADVALAFLATPTDVFAVPREAVEWSADSYAHRSAAAKLGARPLKWASRGGLLHRAYQPDDDPGICDALVAVQGPNYALAKRLQRWRATVARAEGRTVSFHVAPSSRTRSVVKNRALAAAFAGAHRFGVEIFEPSTANTLMAALLVRDLQVPAPTFEHPWQAEANEAVHGGLWRTTYAPRSALGIAALLGYTTSR